MKTNRTSASLTYLAFSYFSVLLALVQGLILVPLYLKKIPLELYGAWLATGNIVAYLSLFDLGLSGVVQQQAAYAYGKRDFKLTANYMGAGVVVMGGVCILMFICGLAMTKYIPGLVNITGDSADQLKLAYILSMVATSFTVWTYAFAASSVALQGTFFVGLSNNLSWILGIGVTVFALIWSDLGLIAIPVGYLTRALLFFILNFFYFFRISLQVLNLTPKAEIVLIIKLLKLTTLVAVSQSVQKISFQIDSLLSAYFIGPQATALLGLTARSMDTIRPIPDRISRALMPGLSHLIGEGNLARAKEIVLDLLNISFSLAVFFCAAVIGLNKSFMTLWVGPQFFAGQLVTVVLGLGFVAFVLRSSLVDSLFAAGEIKSVSLLGLVEIIVRLGLAVLLVSTMGLIGIPLSGLIAVLLVNGVALVQLLVRRFGIKKLEMLREARLGIGYGGLSLFVGLIWGGAIQTKSLVEFLLSSFTLSILLGCILIILNPRIGFYFQRFIKPICRSNPLSIQLIQKGRRLAVNFNWAIKDLFLGIRGARKLHCIGDSHVLVFKHMKQAGTFSNTIIKVCLVDGATAMGISNPNSKTNALIVFREYIDRKVNQNDYILVSLGEVDTGFVIWYRAQKYSEPVSSQFDRSVGNYLGFLEQVLKNHEPNRVIVYSVPLPTIKDGQAWGEVANLRKEITVPLEERTKLTFAYNEKLRDYCAKRGIFFLDIENFLFDNVHGVISDDYVNPNPLDHHLNPATVSPLLSSQMRQWGFS